MAGSVITWRFQPWRETEAGSGMGFALLQQLARCRHLVFMVDLDQSLDRPMGGARTVIARLDQFHADNQLKQQIDYVLQISDKANVMVEKSQRNVLGSTLTDCSHDPKTGFYRNGCCETGPDDAGVHTVCAEMTEAFLDFSRSRGNDLSMPRPEFGFPGLNPGDRWCLCAARWLEAFEADRAPRVRLEATHENTLEIVSLGALKAHALERCH